MRFDMTWIEQNFLVGLPKCRRYRTFPGLQGSAGKRDLTRVVAHGVRPLHESKVWIRPVRKQNQDGGLPSSGGRALPVDAN